MLVIFPYQFAENWVFDDQNVGLVKEMFVGGIPEIIDVLVADIPDAAISFKMLFSAQPFPQYQAELSWLREECGGNWYEWRERQMQGWLGPTLCRYFEVVPDKLYCKAEAVRKDAVNEDNSMYASSTPAEPTVDLPAKNKYVIEPTVENLERYQRVEGTKTYWHTSDFFKYDRNLEAELSDILNAYTDALEEFDEECERTIELSIGRRIVKAARKAGISPQDYRDQFNNFGAVIWTPICIWREDESGNMRYSLTNSLESVDLRDRLIEYDE